jgi:hypothetical protein
MTCTSKKTKGKGKTNPAPFTPPPKDRERLFPFPFPRLFPYKRHQSHEAGTFDRVLDGALKSSAVAAALSAKYFSLAGAKFLQALNVLVIDKCRPGATLFGAKPATIFSAPS